MIPIKGYATFDPLKHCCIGSGFNTMQDLDDAMTITIDNKDVDQVHVGFNQYVDTDTIQHFLFRDFPDDLNKSTLTGTQEQFKIKDIVEATKKIEPKLWKK